METNPKSSTSTLLFRHLPKELSEDERKDLLHHLGAVQVKVFGQYGPMKNTAFGVFSDEAKAKEVVSQLHQVEFLGSRLIVEFARSDHAPSCVDQDGMSAKCEGEEDKNGPAHLSAEEKQLRDPKEVKFDSTFHTWSLKHPRRPDLCYQYPPPTPSTLTNILHALAAVPKFYVQVLHLMNKMDLPAPFGMVTPAPPVHPNLQDIQLPDDVAQAEMDISSSAESELESDGEGKMPGELAVPCAFKKSLSTKRRALKRPRLSELHDTAVHIPPHRTANVAVSEIFETQSDATSAKKIALKLPPIIATTPASQAQVSNPSLTIPFPSDASKSSSFTNQSIPLVQPLHLTTKSHTNQYIPSMKPLHSTSKTKPSVFNPPLPPQAEPSPPPNVQLPSTPSTKISESSQSDSLPANDLYDPLFPLPVSDFPLAKDTENSRGRVSSPTEELYGPHPADKVPPAEREQRPSSPTNKAMALGTEHPPGTEAEPRGGFGILQPVSKDKEVDESGDGHEDKGWSDGKFISSSELRKSRLSKSEMQELSVFRRYSEGQPSCRLYIKNLARQTTEEDLHWIYGRYVQWSQEVESNIFDIRLMKEGRMKGQAFVTLPSESSATRAVQDTNGFLLRDKPMVVQFARSARAEEDKAAIPKE